MAILSSGPTLRATLTLFALLGANAYKRENEFKLLDGHRIRHDFKLPLPHSYIAEDRLPESFTWGAVDGVNYLTSSLNQHVPQYCGSCWAHGAVSALQDRIKIARGAKGEDIELSIQFILNCAGEVAGSCHGGSSGGVNDFIKNDYGYIPYVTCAPYVACSDESTEGFCRHVDTTCSGKNVCRTCNTFSGMGGECVEVDRFPNATIAEYGELSGNVHEIKAEIYARGPVATGISADTIVDYRGGLIEQSGESSTINHIVSIVGWDVDATSGKEYWIVRNSWGQYWGEMGYFKIETGSNVLGIESYVTWATPGTFTEVNYPCNENGDNCGPESVTYVDSSHDLDNIDRRLQAHSSN